MNNNKRLNHTNWDCKYHVVWIPKYRKKIIYGHLRKYLGEIMRELALQKESQILEGHLMGDHVHILIAIPPKYSVSQVVGYIKGKSAIHIARTYNGRKQNFTGQNFWARGYFVSTVGRDEETVKNYIRKQEEADRRIDQLELFWEFSKFCVTGWVSGSASAPAEVKARSENGPSICHIGGVGFCWSGVPETIFSICK